MCNVLLYNSPSDPTCVICCSSRRETRTGATVNSSPDKVKVALTGSTFNVEGPFGKKSIPFDIENFNLEILDGKKVTIKPKKLDQNSKRLWGMNRSLINNAIIGANSGYEKTLELVGVGYRASLKADKLNLQLGFSHDINFDIPKSIKIMCSN